MKRAQILKEGTVLFAEMQLRMGRRSGRKGKCYLQVDKLVRQLEHEELKSRRRTMIQSGGLIIRLIVFLFQIQGDVCIAFGGMRSVK